METSRWKLWFIAGSLFLLSQGAASDAEPVGTGFMYQGSIMDGDQPAEGLYDFQFKLFDAPTDGNQVGRTVDVNGVDVSAGCLTVELDFVPDESDSLQPQGLSYDKIYGLTYKKIWGGGEARWLEIGLRRAGPVQTLAVEAAGLMPYTVLVPRRKIAPVAYALHALSSGAPGGDEGGLYDVLRRSSSWDLAAGETVKPDAVKYKKVSLYLLQVVKDLKSENDSLKQRLDLLERRMEKLERDGSRVVQEVLP